MSNFITGGWHQALTGKPFTDFDVMMYGMVTNLDGLTTGLPWSPGWSPELNNAPRNNPAFKGKTLWVYGGAGCVPDGRPSNMNEVSRIIAATKNRGWDGVDFDDECNMNLDLIAEAMKQLKASQKDTSFGFIAGWAYNNPITDEGIKINEKVKKLVTAGHCDRFVHYCYANAMWGQADILNNVIPALKRTINYGADKKQVILALTSIGLTDWNLNYFIDQVIDLDIGGLFIWNYEGLTAAHHKTINDRLNPTA